MNIELKRKLLHIVILDRQNNTREILFHNSTFHERAFKEDVEKYDIKVTVYRIENNNEFLIYKDISPLDYRDKVLGLKKVKLSFTGYNDSIIDLANFKFNPKFNWGLIF